jgi:ATP-dependent helicase Lhr and Lhr-like helicase
MRTGDTATAERVRFSRRPSDILITTPESLFLLLTSQARDALRSVDTVIIDEIHAVAGTKRGSHLFLSLERLEEMRGSAQPLTRIGLSATQRPLEEIAQLLGGFDLSSHGTYRPRPVTIADARETRPIQVSIELPVSPSEDDAAKIASRGATEKRSIWDSIYSRLVELVRAHRSTMIFVNNRRLAERLCAAINDIAGEPLARAHHGSVAREQRVQIEEALKSGQLPCIAATSSLELGLDIGTVDQVIQIESPPSIASGIQRVGRADHRVGGNPRGLLFPKHRGDLVACVEAARLMREGKIEPTRYPRNALDVLAQQVVAIVASQEAISVDALFHIIRRASPYADLPRAQLDSVLDMLSGRYPSDAFAELRPRLTWNRRLGTLSARKGAKHLAIANAGVIPDRGLFGVFVADGDKRQARRVGELDEEMVFESRIGDVFVLGASSWQIQEITHDRVLVNPLPGRPGRMPFWHGDGPGRSVELGRAIGALLRHMARFDAETAHRRLTHEYHLDDNAADTFIQYLFEQKSPPYLLPTDHHLVIERFIDQVGDYRVCILSPYGTRVHTPLALCIEYQARQRLDTGTESIWSDDGIVLRFPDRAEPPDLLSLFPPPEDIERILTQALSGSALFASHFRECAARALLLPRRGLPGRRTPLWAQRLRAKGLLDVAARYGSFPIILETFRECLQEVFDVPALVRLMEEISEGSIKVSNLETERPSPFASTLLFGYIGHFMYEGDAPLAERRAAALSIDPVQLRELLGQVELKDLLLPEAIEEVEKSVARLNYPVRDLDDLHDLLLWLGDLSTTEISQRMAAGSETMVASLVEQARALQVTIAGKELVIAVENAARYRDLFGLALPPGVPAALLASTADPLAEALSRYARTHGPFRASEVSGRYGLSEVAVAAGLDQLTEGGKLVRGDLHPNKPAPTFCDVEVMRAIKRRSLAELRHQVEPIDAFAYARFLLRLHGIINKPAKSDNLLSILERLEGAPLCFSALEGEILPARMGDFVPSALDQLLASGALVWRGIEPSASGGGRIALYFRENFSALAPPSGRCNGTLAEQIRQSLQTQGAMFFGDLVERLSRFAPDILRALWELVWAGEVTNDTLQPLRSLVIGGERERRRGVRISRSLPGSEGRWSLLRYQPVTETVRRTALVQKLLLRQGVVMREALKAEGISGGFSAVYEVLKVMEEAGRVRRGYFVEGLGAAQFVEPGMEERLRACRAISESGSTHLLASTDPASPWGAALAWPPSNGPQPTRSTGSQVIIAGDGRLLAWVSRRGTSVVTFLRDAGPDRSTDAHQIVQTLEEPLQRAERRAILIEAVDGQPPHRSELGDALTAAGFQSSSRGSYKRAPLKIADF